MQHRSVTIFGSSSVQAGSEEYENAVELGKRLALRNLSIVSGGYGGTMEAVSKGAYSTLKLITDEQGKTVPVPENTVEISGIICSPLFVTRKEQGNRYLTKIIDSQNLIHRLQLLVESSQCFIALPGSLGTATEMMLVWNVLYCNYLFLKEQNAHQHIKLIAFREGWEQFIETCCTLLAVKQEVKELIVLVGSVEEALKRVHKFMEVC